MTGGRRPPRALGPVLGVLLVLQGAGAGAAYEEVAVTDGGTLSGTVRFVGPPPRRPPIHVDRNQDVCGDRASAEVLVVGPEGGVEGSVILVEGVTRGKRVEGETVIDTRGCRFVPRVAAVTAGARVRVHNADPIVHNPRGDLGRRPVFNLALPGRDRVIDITRRLRTPGVVRVVCGVHAHMLGWLVVHESPYVAVTDARGAWRIDGVPPGRYRITMWHEGFRPRGVDGDGRPLYDAPRTVTREVTVPPRGAVTVDFELRARDDIRSPRAVPEAPGRRRAPGSVEDPAGASTT